MGGFSKLNMLEKIEESQNEHYALSDKNFMEIKKYEKELIKLSGKEKLSENIIRPIIENLNNNLINQIELTKNITSKLESIVISGKQDIFEDPFDENNIVSNDLSLFPDSIEKQKIKLITQNDEISILKSNESFIKNYNFNLILQYLLSFEMFIMLILNLLNKKINLLALNETTKKILSSLIISYVLTIKSYNENNNNLLKIEIPSNFPSPFTYNENICFCNHSNKKTNPFPLLISGLEVKFNYYSSELNNFCKTTCLNTNSLNTIKENKSSIKLNNDNNIRKYSTLIYNPNKIRIRNFSSSNRNHVNNEQIKNNSNLNYNKRYLFNFRKN